MNIRIKKVLSWGVLVAIVALFIYYIFKHISDFGALKIVSPEYMVIIAIFSVIGLAMGGIVTKYLVEAFGIKLNFKEWFGLNVISVFYNTITPFRGGMLARAVYLKNKHKFSYTNFIASLAGIYVINYLVASLIGLVSIWLIYARYGLYNPLILVAFLAFFIPLTLIVLFSPKFPETKNNFINKFIKVMNGWNLIKDNRKVIFIVLIVALTQFVLSLIGTSITYRIIGVYIPFDKIMFLVAISTIGGLLQITPGNLGVSEAIAVFAALLIGITSVQSLTVAIIGRAIGLIVLFILGPIYSYLLIKERNRKNEKKRK